MRVPDMDSDYIKDVFDWLPSLPSGINALSVGMRIRTRISHVTTHAAGWHLMSVRKTSRAVRDGTVNTGHAKYGMYPLSERSQN